MTRVRDPDATRAALTGAGLRLAARGLHGLSVNEVTAEAQVAKGTFYVHFASRADYLLALHRSFHDRGVELIEEALRRSPAGGLALIAGAQAYLDHCLRERAARAMLLEARVEPLIQEEIGRRNAQLAALAVPHFAALGWSHPPQASRLFVALVAEAALQEIAVGSADPAVRATIADVVLGVRTAG